MPEASSFSFRGQSWRCHARGRAGAGAWKVFIRLWDLVYSLGFRHSSKELDHEDTDSSDKKLSSNSSNIVVRFLGFRPKPNRVNQAFFSLIRAREVLAPKLGSSFVSESRKSKPSANPETLKPKPQTPKTLKP